MKYIIVLISIGLFGELTANAAIYQCIDSKGQRIYSDKPCAETNIGQGSIDNFDAGAVELKKMPVVLDESVADKIRYRLTPLQAKVKYCATYTESDRKRLISMRQIVLGMYVSDVIKVWGAPLKSDGNQVFFEDDDDNMVVISLIEGCVINIQHVENIDYGYDDIEIIDPD